MTALIVLVALVAAAELARIGQVALVDRRARRELASLPPAPELPDLEALAEAIAERMPAPAPACDQLDHLIAHKYIITMTGAEGMFAGVLTDVHVIVPPVGKPLLVHTFEQCSTLPADDGDTPRDIAGRVIIDDGDIAYLQQIG